jgi:renalase
MRPRIGIVGAGVAGLACAERLRSIGDIMLVDKGRRPGGRLTTVTIGNSSWDLGAPFFTACDPQFRAQVMDWQRAGWVARWDLGPPNAWVGVTSMASLIAEQSRGHEIMFGFQARSLVRKGCGWTLESQAGRIGPFDALVVAVPAEQAAPLLSLHDLDAARDAASIRSSPCWAVMVEFARPLPVATHLMSDWGIFSLVASNRSKPARGEEECWILHANGQWSRDHLELSPVEVAPLLLEAFAAEISIDLPEPSFIKAHRWRYSRPRGQSGDVIWNPALGLGACGDWCTEPTVEGAWLSGVRLAEKMIGTMGENGARLDGDFRHGR